jgi:hypothetical protein
MRSPAAATGRSRSATSQTITTPSSAALANNRPSVLNATTRTVLRCPGNRHSGPASVGGHGGSGGTPTGAPAVISSTPGGNTGFALRNAGNLTATPNTSTAANTKQIKARQRRPAALPPDNRAPPVGQQNYPEPSSRKNQPYSRHIPAGLNAALITKTLRAVVVGREVFLSVPDAGLQTSRCDSGSAAGERGGATGQCRATRRGGDGARELARRNLSGNRRYR